AMSRNTRTHRSRSLALAGFLVAASLALPKLGLAQADISEHALFNQVSVTSFRPSGPRAHPAAAAEPAVSPGITGERALLGHTPALPWGASFNSTGVPAQPRRTEINGEAALLGRWD